MNLKGSKFEKCSVNEDGGEASSFDQHVAFCLSRLSDRQRAIACIEIDKALNFPMKNMNLKGSKFEKCSVNEDVR